MNGRLLDRLSCSHFFSTTIVVIGAGYIYGHLANQEMPLETQDAAVGGGATGAAAGIGLSLPLVLSFSKCR